MGSLFRAVVLLSIAGALFVFYAATFTVQQTESAIVFRFGAVRDVVKEPGLYFKWPAPLENVTVIDKRILDLDLPAQEVIASDQKRLVVDAFTRYRVIDSLKFFQTVNNINGANQRLTSIVNATVRSVLAESLFSSIVRTDRSALMHRIRDAVNEQAQGFGLVVVDVRLRRADLPEQNSQAVFQRMQTERQREAADIRAQGSEQSQTIRARADRDVTVLIAEANRKAEEFRGVGDAERNRVFAEAFGREPEFFNFYRTMQAYEVALKAGETKYILSPDSDFFKFLQTPSGKRPEVR
jgi:modulator of FtsH protease HflC